MLPERLVIPESLELLGHIRHTLRMAVERRFASHFDQARIGRRQDRSTGCERLEDRQSESLIQRWEREESRALIERPEIIEELTYKIPFYRARHAVKPGLTGWAQVRYPYGATDEDAMHKLQYDLYYVKNHSLFLDLMILFQTVQVVLWGKGVR